MAQQKAHYYWSLGEGQARTGCGYQVVAHTLTAAKWANVTCPSCLAHAVWLRPLVAHAHAIAAAIEMGCEPVDAVQAGARAASAMGRAICCTCGTTRCR